MEIVAFLESIDVWFQVWRVFVYLKTPFYELLQDIILFLFDDNNEQISVRIYINSLMFSAIH